MHRRPESLIVGAEDGSAPVRRSRNWLQWVSMHYSEGRDRQQPEAGPLGNGFVRETIEKLRLRLLDLTSRNPLISFKHSARGRRHIRVIDELLDQLFAKLGADSGMRLQSLGREPNEPEDEKTIAFRRALDAAKLEDAEYLEELRKLGEDPGEKAVERLEQELRKRLRERIGMPPRREGAALSPADVARRLGLDPAFDLPTAPAGAELPGKHADSAMQTCLFEDDMQLTLARMREVVRLSIDEGGVNPLFCAFGFLEWYEDANSEIPLHAPLLLRPLKIDRKLARGNYQYVVRGADEETEINVALAERLKRDFDLVLPAFDEGETPEVYLAKIQKVIERQQAWKVRRWITLGLFSFARIAMYRDLAPERWAALGGLDQHPCLSRLIAGGSAAAGGDGILFGSSQEAESADGELEYPLIADADSSQLAAMKDVLAGRNLVIEGPPGTGKSQTIMNIIAGTLAAGKTVLFLAEKMAALNVVRDRLDAAGLDDFCLQLHSTKAGRKETALALAKRLNRPPARQADHELQAVLSRLQSLRDVLGRCVNALGQPAGQLGITVQQLLWRCNAVRQESAALPSEIDEITLANADELTEIDIGRIVSAVEQFERVRAGITQSYGSVARHPWNGIARHDIDPILAEDIVRRVTRLSEAASCAAQVSAAITSLAGIALDAPCDLGKIIGVQRLGAPSAKVVDAVVSQMADPQTLSTMERFAGDLDDHHLLHMSVGSAFTTDDAAERCSADELSAIAKAAAAADGSSVRVCDSAAWEQRHRQEAAEWEARSALMSRISSKAGWSAERTASVDAALVWAVELAADLESDIIGRRIPPVLAPGISVALRAAIAKAAELRQQREVLGNRFELAALPDPSILRQNAFALRSAPILPFLSLGWWRARRAFAGLAKEQLKPRRAEMSKTFSELASFQEGLSSFNGDATIAACADTGFKGIDTNLDPMLGVAEWAERVRTRLPAGDDANDHLRRLLFTGSLDQFETMAALSRDPQFAALRAVLAAGALSEESVEASAKASKNAAEEAARAAATAGKIGLKPNLKLGDCAELAGDLRRARELREEVGSSQTAANILGGHFKGHQTDRDLIIACAQYIRSIDALGLPPAMRSWLLASDSTARLSALRPLAEQADGAVAAMKTAVDDLERCTKVDYRVWLGTSSPMESKAVELRDHTRRCIEDTGGFQALIDDRRLLKEIEELGLKPLLETIESKQIPLTGLGHGARRVIFQSLARAAIASQPALANFSGERHEANRKEFRELDQKLKRLRQQNIASMLEQRPIDPGSDAGPRKQWSGRALINNEISKQRAHIATRDLVARAGGAIQQLMPCFMMSPLSVAQFLKPGALKFDLIVMDEASQLRPEDAVGAIARGGQIVIVGDPKQLPPTNFFKEASGPADEEEMQGVADEESILDQALTIMRPARRLKWHYRSRHGSLIAFSNKEFYDNQLVVFPSPYHDHEDFGVKYVHVSDGQYRQRVNAIEARHVAAAALEYAAKHPERSLGIVTLNQPQAELLSLEIDRLAAEYEEFEAWRQQKEQSLEPFFVKNLENVQGDERDAIFISTVYGRDEEGNFFQRFGPINNTGGHRRLNVLFTRAKCQTVVFSNIDPSDIRTDESSPWGVRALKGYLKFAKEGILSIARESGRAADSEFEVAVAQALQTSGFEIVPQVGVVGYFIDIGVRHPKKPGEFALGVECDGAMYHSSRSARDRDRLRQEVLERLKWRIHRIWSLDWYRNPKREKEKLLKSLAQAIGATL